MKRNREFFGCFSRPLCGPQGSLAARCPAARRLHGASSCIRAATALRRASVTNRLAATRPISRHALTQSSLICRGERKSGERKCAEGTRDGEQTGHRAHQLSATQDGPPAPLARRAPRHPDQRQSSKRARRPRRQREVGARRDGGAARRVGSAHRRVRPAPCGGCWCSPLRDSLSRPWRKCEGWGEFCDALSNSRFVRRRSTTRAARAPRLRTPRA